MLGLSVSAATALSLLVCISSARTVPGRVTALGASSYRGAQSSAQAAFEVPCHGCLGGVDDDALFFDFESFPTSQPCGQSNLRLNGQELVQEWHSTHANGSGVLPLLHNARFQDLELNWETNCLSDNTSAQWGTDDSALVLTVTISKLGERTPQSLSGFTASFKQYPQSELLRLDLHPISPVPQNPAEEWRNPPAHLRLGNLLPNKVKLSLMLDQRLRELEILKAQKQELNRLIEAKQEQIKSELQAQGQDFDYELRDSETFDSAFEVITHRVKDAFNFLYYRITSSPWVQSTLNYPASGRIPHPNMHSGTSGSHDPVTSHVSQPSPVHLPFESSSQGTSYASYEKLPDEEYQRRPTYEQQSQRRRNPFIDALHFILVLFGLIALVAFLRRRCASLRTRTERAANREERRNRRAFRRAARRAAWKNWWRSGWGRRRDEERRMDYEEKRALIQEQESRLEGAMHDEILSLRQAHGVVDELVRAEEGRGTIARPVIVRGRMPGMASIAGVMMGRDIYSTSHLSGSTAISETEDGSTVLTPPPTSATFTRSMSRSNSLPSYRTDPTHHSAPSSRFGDSDVDGRSLFSEPPAYQTDPEDSDDESHNEMVGAGIVTNGFTRYTPSEYAHSLLSPTDTASIFTPNSSIPDVSPRESAETVRTFM